MNEAITVDLVWDEQSNDAALLSYLESVLREAAEASGGKALILDVGSSDYTVFDRFLNLADVHYLDKDPIAVEKLLSRGKTATRGDVVSIDLKADTYDVVWSSYLLEHVQEALVAIENMISWIKPGGVCVIRVPDPNSLWGCLSAMLPRPVKILCLRAVGRKNAGLPGCPPYPTYYHQIVSRTALAEYCAQNGYQIELFHSYGVKNPPFGIPHRLWRVTAVICRAMFRKEVDEGRGDFVIAFRKPVIISPKPAC